MEATESVSQSLKVFLIEDSEMISNMISDKLELLKNIQLIGKSSQIYGTYNQLLHKKPDVVILDLKLKDGNGIELLERIKQTRLVPKIIIYTMYNSFENECKRAGCDFFLDKTGNINELVQILINLSNK